MLAEMATGRSNIWNLPASAACGLPPSDNKKRHLNSVLLGAEDGVDLSSYHGFKVSPEEWYGYVEDTAAMNKEAESVLPAAAGDSSPASNYRNSTNFVPDNELLEEDEDRWKPKLSRRAYSEQLDRRLLHDRAETARTRPVQTQSDKTVGHWTKSQSNKSLGLRSRPADTDVDDMDMFDDMTHRCTLPAVGAGDTGLAQSTASYHKTGYTDHHVEYSRRTPSIIRGGRSTHSVETASEPAQNSRYLDREDVSLAKSDMTDAQHTRRLTKTDRRSDITTLYSRQQQHRSDRVSRLTEQHNADDMSQPDETQYETQYELEVRPTSRQSESTKHWTDDDPRPHGRSALRHYQPRHPIIDRHDDAPRRLVFRRSNRQDDSEDVIHEDASPCQSTSVIKRVKKARNVQSLLRAVNKAAMRVNPTDPDAFLSLLSTRPGRAEQLHDFPQLYDQAVQTDQPPQPQVDDTKSLAMLKQLQHEMSDLIDHQQRITTIFTYIMAPVTFILMLLFANKLWAAMNSVVDVAEHLAKQDM